MIFARKYSLEESGVLKGATDIHTHILFGVDDGIKRSDSSIAALSEMREKGVKEVWLTPHIMEDVPNSTEFLLGRFGELKSLLAEGGCCNEVDSGMSLKLAAEYMVDSLFFERLAAGDLLTFPNKTVLVEFSTMAPPINLKGSLARIKSAGYWPMLAHPERYPYLTKEDYRSIVDMGVILQLNTSSITGHYGKEVKRRARWILREGLYRAIGSDTHRTKQISAVASAKALERKDVEALRKIAGGLIF
ncbi:MAG: capsular biosynthesis protein [Bacteroidales bacterium]|nr:capsular biosynthesis protein [Bacteroidales bacterium]